jgi:hypothetical protein
MELDALEPRLGVRPKFRDKGEFCRGEPYLFFKDLDDYEVEIVRVSRARLSEADRNNLSLHNELAYGNLLAMDRLLFHRRGFQGNNAGNSGPAHWL